MDFPADLKYTENDEWVRVEGSEAVCGISDFAQDQLSDIVFVEILVSEGDSFKKGDSIASVESVKTAADVYAPVSGKVTAVNEALMETPEVVNTDPYGAAWIIRFELSDPAEVDALLSTDDYRKNTEERAH
ncbi:MAG: glycine cleavage system protein GcvH [Anaerolineales bacterium]|nr:glycine cleavage system protein GcvH [Anaerolineales bacterium]